AMPGAKPGEYHVLVERGLHRVWRDVRDGRGQRRPAAVEEHVAERALVGEPQFRARVGEREPDPDVWGHRLPRLAEQQLAAHPEVRQQRILGYRADLLRC